MKSIRFSRCVTNSTYAYLSMEAASLQGQRTTTMATRKLSQHKTTCTIKALPSKLWPENHFLLSALCYIDKTKQLSSVNFLFIISYCRMWGEKIHCILCVFHYNQWFHILFQISERSLKHFIINALRVPLKIYPVYHLKWIWEPSIKFYPMLYHFLFISHYITSSIPYLLLNTPLY